MEGNSSPLGRPFDAKQVDSLMDSGLAAYSTGEPRSGLEQRIVARIRMDRSNAPERSLRWSHRVPLRITFACLLLALVSAAGWVGMRRNSRGEEKNDAAAVVQHRIAAAPVHVARDLALPLSPIEVRKPAIRVNAGLSTSTEDRMKHSQPAVFLHPRPLLSRSARCSSWPHCRLGRIAQQPHTRPRSPMRSEPPRSRLPLCPPCPTRPTTPNPKELPCIRSLHFHSL